MKEKELALALTAFDSLCKLICYKKICEECPLSIKIDVGQEQISICEFLCKAKMQIKNEH